MCSVVNRIRELIEETGIKQKDLIEHLEVNQGTFGKWISEKEENRRDIPNTVLAKIAEYLDVDIEYLLCMQDQKRELNTKNTISVDIIEIKASAGGGNEIVSMDSFSTGRKAIIDVSFFKTVPSENLKCIQVDGYSMLPMLSHESWVIYREVEEFETDGLYIINYDNQLMVKMVQVNFAENKLDIISLNKEYQSYSIDKHDQTVCKIVGRVIRSIV